MGRGDMNDSQDFKIRSIDIPYGPLKQVEVADSGYEAQEAVEPEVSSVILPRV
jgi:hypothetical protein